MGKTKYLMSILFSIGKPLRPFIAAILSASEFEGNKAVEVFVTNSSILQGIGQW